MREMIENCRQHLTEAKKLASASTLKIPKNFSELYDTALTLELKTELKKLKFLFKESDDQILKAGFLKLCAKREENNAHIFFFV